MKLLLINQIYQYLEILHLTDEEEKFVLDYDIEMNDCEKVEKILDDRGISHDDFNPQWMFAASDDAIPVYDEEHQENPLTVL